MWLSIKARRKRKGRMLKRKIKNKLIVAQLKNGWMNM